MCESIVEEYDRLLTMVAKFKVCTEFLSDEGGARRAITSSGDEVQCEHCGNIFSRRQYGEHKKRLFVADFRCDCVVTWSNAEEKRAHVQAVHLKARGFVRCSESECEFVGRENMMERHRKREHDPCTCEHCGEHFAGNRRLQEHAGEKHRERRKKPARSGGRRGGINRHGVILTKIPYCGNKSRKPGEQQVPTCSACGKTYATSLKLYSHFRGQHAERRCSLCDFKAVGEGKMRMHMRRVHPTPSDLPQQCRLCGKTLRDSACLQIHIQAVHTEESQRKHPCDQCPRRFASYGNLWSHKKRTHSKERPYLCRFGCGQNYKEPSDRVGHESKKHGMSYARYQSLQKQGQGGQEQAATSVQPT